MVVGLLLAAVAPALAYDDPKALVDAIYTHYTDRDFDWSSFDDASIRSRELNELFARDADQSDGEVGRIDYDPYINAQDYELSDLVVSDSKVDGDHATIDVSFTNFDYRVNLTYALVKESDGWKVDDVKSLDASGEWMSLHDLLAAPLP